MSSFGGKALARSVDGMNITIEKYNKFVRAGENPYDFKNINRGNEALEWIDKNYSMDINKFFLIIPMAVEAQNILKKFGNKSDNIYFESGNVRFSNEENLFIILLGNIINNNLIKYGIELPFYIPSRNNFKNYNQEEDQRYSIKKELNIFLQEFDFSNLKGNSYIDINTKAYLILESLLLERRNNESIILSNKTFERYIANYMSQNIPQYIPFFKMLINNKQIVFNNEFNFDDIILSEKLEEDILEGLYLKVIKNLNNSSLYNFLGIDGVIKYLEENYVSILNSLRSEDGKISPENLFKIAYIYGNNDDIWGKIDIETENIKDWLYSFNNFKKFNKDDRQIINKILDKYDIIKNYKDISYLKTSGFQEVLRAYINERLERNKIKIQDVLSNSHLVNILLNDKDNKFLGIIESQVENGKIDVKEVLAVSEITKKLKPEREFSLIGKSAIDLSLMKYLFDNGKQDLLFRVFTELKDKISLDEGQTIPKEMLPLSNILKLYKEYNSPFISLSQKQKGERYQKLCNYLELYRDNVTYDIIPSDDDVDEIRSCISKDDELMFDSAEKFNNILQCHSYNDMRMAILSCEDLFEKWCEESDVVNTFLQEAFKKGYIKPDKMNELYDLGLVNNDLVEDAFKGMDGDISSKIYLLTISFSDKLSKERNALLTGILQAEPKTKDHMSETTVTGNNTEGNKKPRGPRKYRNGLTMAEIEAEMKATNERVTEFCTIDPRAKIELCKDGYSKITLPSKEIVILEKLFDPTSNKSVKGNATYILTESYYNFLTSNGQITRSKPELMAAGVKKVYHGKNWTKYLKKAIEIVTEESRYSRDMNTINMILSEMDERRLKR